MSQSLNRTTAAADSSDTGAHHDESAVGVLEETDTAAVASQPPAGDRGILGACVGVAAVVLCAVLATVGVHTIRASRAEAQEVRRAEQEESYRKTIADTAAYRKLLPSLGRDLAAGRCTLARAVEQLGRCEALKGTDTMEALRRRTPGRSDVECLATTLMEAALQAERDPQATELLASRLKAEFSATYGTPAPQFRWKTLVTGRASSARAADRRHS
jgi:hypothetical protein